MKLTKLKINQYFTGIVTTVIIFSFFLYPQSKLAAKEKISVKPSDYNVVLIVVDCLRTDHLPSYGYSRKISPNIDDLAKNGILFEQAISTGTNTLLSHGSIFTSQYVPTHGAGDFTSRLDDTALTLAEVLQKYGYKTAAFCGGPLFNPIYQLDQGFDTYYHLNYVGSRFEDIIPKVLEWVQQRKKSKEKFFVFLHGNDLHIDHRPPPEFMFGKDYSKKINIKKLVPAMVTAHQGKIFDGKNEIDLSDEDVEYIIDRYDMLLKFADRQIGYFLDELGEMGLQGNTIIILTADHGEGLFDHDFYMHDLELYETVIHVPLIIMIPDSKKRNIRISHQVSLMDIMPTIIELIGGVVNKEAQGHSLLPLITQKKIRPEFNQYIFSQTPAILGGITIRGNKWKLIYYPEKLELYNLNDDPNEKSNLIEKEPNIALDLMKELFDFIIEKSSISIKKPIKNKTPQYLIKHEKKLKEMREMLYEK